MAQLKDLIVAGSSRFLGNVYFEDSVTLNDTLILAKSTDLSGTADNRPALIVGGLPAAAHIEFDGDEIQAKASATQVGPLYINKDGGNTNIGSSVVIASDDSAATSTTGAIRITGGISASNTSYFGGALNVSGLATFSGYVRTAKGEAATSATSGDIRVDGGIGVAKASYFGSSVVVNGKLTVKGNTALGNAESDTITIKGKTSITGPVTITGNTTHNGIVYFANGTTYYINNSGTGILNELTMLNSIYFGQNKTYYIANTGTGYLNALTTNGAVKMNGGTGSTSVSTGQLVVQGGVGISEKLYTGGTHYANGGVQLPKDQSLTQVQNLTSNYTTAIKWLQNGVSEKTYNPHIGHHNTAEIGTGIPENNPDLGAIVLVPYSTNSNPWDSNDGLYISKKRIKWNNLVTLDSSRNFYPTTDKTGSLGTSSYRWNNLYINSMNAAGNATISGNLEIGGTFKVTGLTTLSRLSLTSTTDATETSYAAVALTIGPSTGQHIEIDNNEIISKTNGSTTGTLYLGGSGSTVSITNNATIGGTVTITGATTINGTTTLNNTLNVTGITTVSNNIIATTSEATDRSVKTINANGSVGLLTSTNRGLYDFTLSRWIIFTQKSDNSTRIPSALYLDSTLRVASTATLAGTVNISGVTKISNTLNVTKAVDFDSTLNVDGNTTLKGTLETTGATTLKSTLNVTGSSTLTGAVTAKSTLAVTSTSTLTGDVTMGAKATINGAASLKDTLTVTKTATFNSDVVINGGTESSSMTTGQLKVVGGIGATKYISAKAYRLDDKVEFVYNATDKCVDVVFK